MAAADVHKWNRKKIMAKWMNLFGKERKMKTPRPRKENGAENERNGEMIPKQLKYMWLSMEIW